MESSGIRVVRSADGAIRLGLPGRADGGADLVLTEAQAVDAALLLLINADPGHRDAVVRRLSDVVGTDRTAQQVEDDVLAAAEQLSPEDRSTEAGMIRATAEDILDHRESAINRTRHRLAEAFARPSGSANTPPK